MNLLLQFLRQGEIARRFLNAACPDGLNLTQSLICFYLAQHSEKNPDAPSLTPGELAKVTGSSEPKLVTQLLPLVQRGFVNKNQGKADTRNRLYRITNTGIQVAAAFSKDATQLSQQVSLMLSNRQLQEMTAFGANFDATLFRGDLQSPSSLDSAMKNGTFKPNRRNWVYTTPNVVKKAKKIG